MPKARGREVAVGHTQFPSLDPLFGSLASQAVVSALELGLLQRLADGPATVATLARSAGANRRGVQMLLDALVGMGQAQREGNRYCLGQFLQKIVAAPGVDPKAYFADSLEHMSRLAADWPRLTDVVRSGRPVADVGTAETGQEFFPHLARHLFPANYLAAKGLVQKLPRKLRVGPSRVLDVAAGSAAWSIPLAEANERCEVVALDFAPVLEVARHFTSSCGVQEQYRFEPGDLRRKRFGTDLYDVVILGHICHSEGAARTRRLFKKVHRALRPGGSMVVVDFVADDGRQGEGTGSLPLIFALNMLVHSERGGTFTFSEYRTWGAEAGFKTSRCIEIGSPSPVILFHKA